MDIALWEGDGEVVQAELAINLEINGTFDGQPLVDIGKMAA